MAEGETLFSNYPECTVNFTPFAETMGLVQNKRHSAPPARGQNMTGYLTTHVLDTARGCPAAGLDITLYRLEGGARSQICMMQTNEDGRTNAPILPQETFAPGTYELEFKAGDYLRQTDQTAEDPLFLDVIPIRFGISDPAAHYHVPLLLSPFGYSTYRGS